MTDRRARIERWSGEQARTQANAVARVYGAAFAGPPYHRTAGHVEDFAYTFTAQTSRPGFQFWAAVAPDGALAGMAYGYTGGPGQWWTDCVSAGLTATARDRWLAGHFELVELAVCPAAQGQGLGRGLHDTLLAALPHPTACLSTIAVETVALAMYRRTGWQTLLAPFRFPGVSEPYIIMGYDLAAAR